MARLEPWGGRDTGAGDRPEKGTILRGAERKRKLDASAEAVSAKKIRREATVEQGRVALWLPKTPAGAQVSPDVPPFFPAGFGDENFILEGRGDRWAYGECRAYCECRRTRFRKVPNMQARGTTRGV